jgi:hypothetical protein
VQIGIGAVAVVVKTVRLAITVVVTLCQCREMDVKEEQRVNIKFCCEVDFSATKIVDLIQKAYGDAALSRTTINSNKNDVEQKLSRTKIKSNSN